MKSNLMSLQYFIWSIFSRKCNLFLRKSEITLVDFLYFLNSSFSRTQTPSITNLVMRYIYIFSKYIPLTRFRQQEYTGKLPFTYMLHKKNDSNENILNLKSSFLLRSWNFPSYNLSLLMLCRDNIYFYFYFVSE